MGSPAFWWSDPGGSGVQHKVSLDASSWPSEQLFEVSPLVGGSRSGYGRLTSVHRGALFRLRVVIPAVTRGAQQRALDALLMALRLGVPVGYTDDDDRAYLAYCSVSRTAGDTTAPLLPPGATAHGAGVAALSSGDAVCLESISYGGLTEELALSAPLTATGLLASFGTGVRFTQPDVGWLRYARYYPVCRIDPDDPPSVTDGGTGDQLFDYTIPLLVDFGAIHDLRVVAGTFGTATTPFTGTSPTLGESLDAIAASDTAAILGVGP